jgi:hypothetical protein
VALDDLRHGIGRVGDLAGYVARETTQLLSPRLVGFGDQPFREPRRDLLRFGGPGDAGAAA